MGGEESGGGGGGGGGGHLEEGGERRGGEDGDDFGCAGVDVAHALQGLGFRLGGVGEAEGVYPEEVCGGAVGG